MGSTGPSHSIYVEIIKINVVLADITHSPEKVFGGELFLTFNFYQIDFPRKNIIALLGWSMQFEDQPSQAWSMNCFKILK